MSTYVRPHTASHSPTRPMSSYSMSSTIRRVTPSPESLSEALSQGYAAHSTPRRQRPASTLRERDANVERESTDETTRWSEGESRPKVARPNISRRITPSRIPIPTNKTSGRSQVTGLRRSGAGRISPSKLSAPRRHHPLFTTSPLAQASQAAMPGKPEVTEEERKKLGEFVLFPADDQGEGVYKEEGISNGEGADAEDLDMEGMDYFDMGGMEGHEGRYNGKGKMKEGDTAATTRPPGHHRHVPSNPDGDEIDPALRFPHHRVTLDPTRLVVVHHLQEESPQRANAETTLLAQAPTHADPDAITPITPLGPHPRFPSSNSWASHKTFSTPGRDEMERKRGHLGIGDEGFFGDAKTVGELAEARRQVSEAGRKPKKEKKEKKDGEAGCKCAVM